MERIVQKWDEILLYIKTQAEMTDVSFNTWLSPLKPYSLEDDILYLELTGEDTSSFFKNYIENHYFTFLRVAIAEITGLEVDIEIINSRIARPKATVVKNTPVTEDMLNSNLNPNYTFDTYVVGNNNRFAHSASLAVAESPGEVYNPLFIYGGVGLGKTHLLHSIAHYVQANQPNLKVIYVSSEEFTNEIIDAIRNGNSSSTKKFREKYRSVDVLLIDDIQFIIGKESTQEEFFNTFNQLRDINKQIIITSDRPPKEMTTLDDRIRSRFEWGLLADIGSPDYETRMAILRKKVERDNFQLDDEILNYIAINIKSNIRELEGALNKLIAYSNLVHEDITMEIAIKELQNLISPDTPVEITPQLIIEVVAEHFGITVDKIMSKSRKSEIVKPRHIAMYLCNEMTDSTLKSIGSLIGGRDHATVINAINNVKNEMDQDFFYKETVEAISKKISPNL